MKYFKITISLLVIASLLSGCTFRTETTVSDNSTGENVLTETPANGMENVDTDRQSPIYINFFGYETDGEKYAFLQEDVEADTFEVVDATTKDTVFSGEITKNQLMDFSDCVESGTYYILVPHVGMSHEFSISDGVYESMKSTLVDKVLADANYKNADFLTKVQTLQWIIRCYERYTKECAGNALYEESASKEGLIQYHLSFTESEIDKLLKETMSVADSLQEEVVDLEEEPSEHLEELASYTALMADLYQWVKETDNKTANTYLTEAVTVYSIIEKNSSQTEASSWQFMAAATLFKNTGQVKYNTFVKTYAKNHTEQDVFDDDASLEELLDDEAYVYGQVAYLNATYKADLATCQQFMEELRAKAEDINANHHENGFLLTSSDHRDRLLTDQSYIVAIMESVIVSEEYVTLLEADVQYIGGCNETGLSLFTDQGVWNSTYDEKNEDTLYAAAYLYLIGQIIEREDVQ